MRGSSPRTWQLQDLRQGVAVVESRGDDAFGPGSFGFQLVHLLARVQAVFAHDHPVVGGDGDDDAQPADAADDEAAQLETRVCHLSVKRATRRFREP